MKDLLHDHLAFGFHEGCPACEQVEDVFRNQELVDLLSRASKSSTVYRARERRAS